MKARARGSRLGRMFGAVLAYLAPSWALSRAQTRRQLHQLEAHYDAAAMSRRTSGWRGPRGDANAVPARTLQRLRDVARDLVRNDPQAKAAKRKIARCAVGAGITPLVRASNPAVKAEATAIWRQWSRSTAADYDGRLWFAGIQGLVMRTCVESGGALIVREPARAVDGLPVPVRIRVLEPDYLDESRDTFAMLGISTGNPVVKGIETDGEGRRVAYWLFPTHPSTGRIWRTVSVRVPADRVIHVFDVDRPGQLSGVPWMDAVITALQDFSDYKDAVRMLAKISSCMVGVVEDTAGYGTAIGEQNSLSEELEHFEPGQFAYLKPGQTVKFNTPPTPQDTEFSADTIREIAVGMGLPAEALSGDYTSATFSSIRASRQDFQLTVDGWRDDMLIPQLCAGVFSWVMELAAALRGWPEVPTATWHASPLPSIEPDKDPKIFTAEIRSGRKSLAGALMERGIPDFEAHVEQVADGFAELDRRGLVLDSDPRKITGAGIVQPDEEMSADE